MKACTGLWIVAPITRAVDDKTAKVLLGDSFRRQLKFDGIQSSVTFICSKTDDISITEVAEGLDFDDIVSSSFSKAEMLKRSMSTLKAEQKALLGTRSAYNHELDETDVLEETWEDLQRQLDDGKTVYPPLDATRKRKRSTQRFSSRKDKVSTDSEDETPDAQSENANNEVDPKSKEDRSPLTADDITERLSALKSERKQIRKARHEVDAAIAGAEAKVAEIQAEHDSLLVIVKSACIKWRNEYSKTQIKQDFAAGIKE